MRFKIMSQGGYGSGLSATGGTLSGPLILASNPTQLLEASNKAYLDTVLSNISATSLTTGTVPVGCLPGFSGDISNTAGSANFTLSNTGVSPGSYPKVAVNAKGRVTNGYTLSASDLPAISWTKISSGKPTTLAGYGITDALPPAGGTVTGPLEVSATATDPLHVINKAYVDTLTGPTESAKTGDLVRKFSATTPTGYLRANGGIISKTTYPALYAVVGDTFAPPLVATDVGRGRPWSDQYEINTTQSAALSNWVNSGTSPLSTHMHVTAVTKNRVYVMGGVSNSGSTYTTRSEVYTAVINADGTLGAWSLASTLPGPKCMGGVVVIKNKLYYIGGLSSWSNGTYANNAYVANINADGTLGTWSTVSAPANMGGRALLYTRNGKLYAANIGIFNSTQFALKAAVINEDGTLGAWGGVSSPGGINHMSFGCVIGDYLYSFNDHDSNTNFSNQIKRATINSDGTLSSFVNVGTSFVTGSSFAQLYVTKNRIYAYAVETFLDATLTTYSAPINADYSLGSWTSNGQITKRIWGTAGFAVSNRLYLYAGFDTVAGAVTNTIQYTTISGGTSDYSPYYDPAYQALDADSFALPDYTDRELDGSYTYIKI